MHRLIGPVAKERGIVLTEETWQVIDREAGPAVLAGVLGLMLFYEAHAGGKAGMEFFFSRLPEIREAWAGGWTCPGDELTFDDGVWWDQPQSSVK